MPDRTAPTDGLQSAVRHINDCRIRVRPRFGGDSPEAPAVNYLPVADRYEIVIPANPRAGRVIFTRDQGRAFFRRMVGFYSRVRGGKLKISQQESPGGPPCRTERLPGVVMSVGQMSYLYMNYVDAFLSA